MDLSKFKKTPRNLIFNDLKIYEDEDYVLINKPAFVSSLPERTEDRADNILKLAKGEYDDIQLCHRLDKETSGILILAKNSEAYRNVAMQFEDRSIKKEYHALVNGVHDFDQISVFLPIAIVKDRTKVRIDRKYGKIAETIFITQKKYTQHSLIRCFPLSGRMHQIRIHLMCLKAPIVCDETYGGEHIYLSKIKRKFNLKSETEELPLIKRVALHAHKITFKDLKNKTQEHVAPYPKDFEVLVKQLDKFN